MTTTIQCPTFKPTLRVGNKGQDVKDMQKRLNDRFASIYTPAFKIIVDGDFGSQTEAAVRFLQCLAFLPVNSITDATTWNFICNGAAGMPILKLNSSGNVVQAVQQALFESNFYNGAIDGIFANQTQQSVKNFQTSQGLTVDGVIGVNTWTALIKLDSHIERCYYLNNSVVIQWNNIYLEAVRKLGGAPGPISRMGAMMHIAMFEAVNLLFGSPYESYLPNAKLPSVVKGADPALAAAYAAYKVLLVTIKQQLQEVNNSTAFSPESFLIERTQPLRIGARVSSQSRTFGEAIADAILRERSNDGSQQANTPPVVKFGFTPGDWRPTDSSPAATPQWGKVKPFGGWQLNQVGDFLPKALNINKFSNYDQLLKSREYAEQVNEVQRLGKADSSERTQEQTEIAFFWANDLDGTYKPPGQLYDITQIVARQEGVEKNLLDTARLFALVGIGMADAAIIAWYVKYLFPSEKNPNNLIRLWRPESAIRLADSDNNPKTVKDPSWQPLSAMRDGTRFSPAFPAYISGHATFGAAHAVMMREFFGRDAIAFSATTEDPNAPRGISRRFTSFTEAALENGRSRIYLGVHYQWDADGGFESGTLVAEFAFNCVLRKKNNAI
ncbi:phosphoesterase [Calothrix sp. NIES-4071]|nr:phosphoesterase [Calothrix sp. NIES-4071]BAZ57285.1 phosphoesterase [Calothrix sp. NIES-4105]